MGKGESLLSSYASLLLSYFSLVQKMLLAPLRLRKGTLLLYSLY